MIHAREIQTGTHRLDIVLVLIWTLLCVGSAIDIVQAYVDAGLQERVEVLENALEQSTLPAPLPEAR